LNSFRFDFFFLLSYYSTISFKNKTEAANEVVLRASEAKKQGDLLSALEYHTQAAKLYKDNALAIRDRNRKLL
jgi:hypothetical protein